MEPNQNKILESSVHQVVRALPPPVRDYLAKGKYTPVARALSSAFGLRIDQAGVLERELMLLIMGVETPDEFAASLKEDAHLSDDVVRNLLQEVNTRVFVPLQEEVRKGFAKFAPPAPPIPGAPAARRPEIPGVQPEVRPGKEGSFFHLENKLPPPVPKTVPAPAVAPRPVAQDVAPVAPRPTPSAAPVAPSNRPGLREALAAANVPIAAPSANRMLEDHEEPHIELGVSDTVQDVRSTPSVPRKPNPVPLTPAPAPAPQNLPGALPPQVIPPGGRPVILQPKFGPVASSGPAAHAPSVPVTPPVTPRPIPPPEAKRPTPPAPKAYAVDPYREPFEEPGA